MTNIGISGDSVIISEESVIKTCKTNQVRFLHNINKQKVFQNTFIKAVPIIEEGILNENNFIKMPFISNNTILNNKLENALIEYLSQLIRNSQKLPFDYIPWINKITDLQTKIIDIDILNILTTIQDLKFVHSFYYGYCHGDLTMSNILINNGTIYTIDFLDTFISSPLLDIVKLRQSSRHHWENRTDLIGLDQQLKIMIESDLSLKEYYIPFQILNLARIWPYVKDENMFVYLKREMNDLYYSHCASGR